MKPQPKTRWLVVFRSHLDGPSDTTVARVRAVSVLAAIAAARRACPPHHPWVEARATPWPAGARGVDVVLDAVCAGAP